MALFRVGELEYNLSDSTEVWKGRYEKKLGYNSW